MAQNAAESLLAAQNLTLAPLRLWAVTATGDASLTTASPQLLKELQAPRGVEAYVALRKETPGLCVSHSTLASARRQLRRSREAVSIDLVAERTRMETKSELALAWDEAKKALRQTLTHIQFIYRTTGKEAPEADAEHLQQLRAEVKRAKDAYKLMK